MGKSPLTSQCTGGVRRHDEASPNLCHEGSASGKSYIASVISAKLDIPKFELDAIFWHERSDRNR